MSLSLVINHAPWEAQRVVALQRMLHGLAPVPGPLLVHETDYRGRPWQEAKVDWALAQWRWALSTGAELHLFMTDDLVVAPGFWSIFEAMREAAPERILGLLSNHPRGPDLALQGWRWYQTSSWIVGSCYALPHRDLESFVGWFEALPDGSGPGGKASGEDHGPLNRWLQARGACALHPLPAPVEKRDDLEPAFGHHRDAFSRERVSWRAIRSVRHLGDGKIEWLDAPGVTDPERLRDPEFWRERGGPEPAPRLAVGS